MRTMTAIKKWERVQIVDNEATGLAMRKHREKEKVSLRKHAERMGLSPAYLSDLERGRRNWSDDLVAAFQTALQ